jgi:tetratricopeptide (TPR) repeat protein
VDEFAWTVLGSAAGVAGAIAAVVFGLIPLLQSHRERKKVPPAAGLPAASAAGGDEVPVQVGEIPQEPVAFQPRARLLSGLDASGSLGRVAVVHAVTGMRGVGKTQLAATYARSKIAAGWRLVAWVSAQDAATLASGMAAVAEAAGLAVQGGDPGLAVRYWLEADGERCLLVFDNAADADLLRPYLPAAGAARVLVTSTRGSVTELGEPVGVAVFTLKEAAAFLAQRTGLTDLAGAEELAEELGFLPLGLAQAAAVIRGQRLGYATYLERLRALPVASYLTRQDGQPYPYGVAESVLLSLQAVQDEGRSRACVAVMELICVLSATGVRRDLLHAAGLAGTLSAETTMSAAAVDETLGRLAEWSLLAFTVDGQVVLAHRLVLRVVHERLAQQMRLAEVCQAAAQLLITRADALLGSRDRLAMRDMPEQVAALRQTAAGLAGRNGELDAALVRLRFYAFYHLNELGDSAAQAIAVGEPLLEECARMLGSDHSLTLTLRNNLANEYSSAARLARAIPVYERTLADRKRLLGPDHPDTLQSQNNLAVAYQRAGLTAEAIPLLERTLADRERLLGPDHPATLGSQGNLANAYLEAGRTAEGISLHERTLPDLERVLGPDHPDTLTSRNNLAAAYLEAGRTAEGISLHERTLPDLERVLGPDHPTTLTSRNNLANAYEATGRTTEAISLHERTLTVRKRVLGPNHPDTLLSQSNLANAYQTAIRTTGVTSRSRWRGRRSSS